MTEQEQKAFNQMREALEGIISAHPVSTSLRQTDAVIAAREALTAANAVSHPQATEPQKAASVEPRTTEQIVLDMEVWFEAQEPMPDSMTAAKEFARRIRNQTEQDIAKVIQRRGWELMRSESGYFLRDATAAEAQ